MKEYGSGVIDIDGSHGQEIYGESLLLLENQNEELAQKLRGTPQTQTPSDGVHVHFQYRKKDFKKTLKTITIYAGKNDHEEIEILANGRYVVEPPSEGYIAIKNDFDKIARISKNEFDQVVSCIRTICGEQQPEEKVIKKTSWTNTITQNDDNTTSEPIQDLNIGALIKIGKKLTQNQRDTEFVLGSVPYRRRYLRMDKGSIHEVIEDLAHGDSKNWETVEYIFDKPMNQIANRLTLRDCIEKSPLKKEQPITLCESSSVLNHYQRKSQAAGSMLMTMKNRQVQNYY